MMITTSIGIMMAMMMLIKRILFMIKENDNDEPLMGRILHWLPMMMIIFIITIKSLSQSSQLTFNCTKGLH